MAVFGHVSAATGARVDLETRLTSPKPASPNERVLAQFSIDLSILPRLALRVGLCGSVATPLRLVRLCVEPWIVLLELDQCGVLGARGLVVEELAKGRDLRVHDRGLVVRLGGSLRFNTLPRRRSRRGKTEQLFGFGSRHSYLSGCG